MGAIDKLLTLMTTSILESRVEGIAPPELQEYTLTRDSRFLDIGSGIGKVVMHIGHSTRCRAHGIEVLLNRVSCAN